MSDTERKVDSLFPYVKLLQVTGVEEAIGDSNRWGQEYEGKGVSIELSGTGGTWDYRFSKGDIQPGDIVRWEARGPSMGVVTEVFRKGVRIFPEEQSRAERILDLKERSDKESLESLSHYLGNSDQGHTLSALYDLSKCFDYAEVVLDIRKQINLAHENGSRAMPELTKLSPELLSLALAYGTYLKSVKG